MSPLSRRYLPYPANIPVDPVSENVGLGRHPNLSALRGESTSEQGWIFCNTSNDYELKNECLQEAIKKTHDFSDILPIRLVGGVKDGVPNFVPNMHGQVWTCVRLKRELVLALTLFSTWSSLKIMVNLTITIQVEYECLRWKIISLCWHRLFPTPYDVESAWTRTGIHGMS